MKTLDQKMDLILSELKKLRNEIKLLQKQNKVQQYELDVLHKWKLAKEGI